MKIIIDDKIPFLKGILDDIADVHYIPGSEISKEIVSDADALIVRTRTMCNSALLANSQVKAIATATIGYDHIDTEFCNKNNITWSNAKGCNAPSVAQYITSVLLNLSVKHNIPLQGKTLGIIGVGNVGKEVEKVAKAFGMKVLLNDPIREKSEDKIKWASLTEIATCADFITVHTPLTLDGDYKTYHLIDDKFLRLMQPKAFLINSSRGEVVCNQSLKSALHTSQIKGAVLDVWENEPNIDLELLSLLDIATPHIAGYSADGKAQGTAMSVQFISKFFNLNLNNWTPNDIPMPKIKNINFAQFANIENKYEILLNAYNYSYDILSDDNALRANPENFEKLRGNYPLRRELKNFSFLNIPNELKKLFESL